MSDTNGANQATSTDERTSPETAFRQENITLREHIDPDKHWIGESLPAASDKEARPVSTVLTSAGQSIFPARADHVHDTSQYWGVFTNSGQTIAPGQGFISGLGVAGGRDLRAPASTSIIQFPVPGVWQILFVVRVDRIGGGNFSATSAWNIVNFYFNGTAQRPLFRDNNPSLPSIRYASVTDIVHLQNVDATSNVQIAIQHDDSVNWTVTTTALDVRRLCAYTTA